MMKMNFKTTPQTVEKWQALGFAPETLPLALCAPLVQIGWAEGFLQGAERRAILRFARENGLTENAAGETLRGWLDDRPTDGFFASANEILRALLAEMPPAKAARWRKNLQAACLEVADASAAIGIRRDRETLHRAERFELERLGHRLGFSFV